MSKKSNQPDPQLLRSAAEAQFVRSRAIDATSLPAEELLHELQVHQIELEMQNEELRRSQLALEKSRDHYIEFYDFAPVGYLTLSDKGLISEINLTGAAMLGVERNQLLRQRLARFVADEEHDRMQRHFMAVLKHDEKQTCEMLLKRGDGSSFYAQLDCLQVEEEGGTFAVRIVLSDISERRRKEEALREQEEFFRMIAENTDDFITVLDLEGWRLYNNPTYTRFFGDTKIIEGTDIFFEVHPEDQERIKDIFRKTISSGVGMHADCRFVLPDGSIRHMESRGGLIRDSRGQALYVVVVSRDITERKQAEEKIYNLAFFDSLTKLPNRRLLNDRLEQAMAASKRSERFGALMFIDLDNFKPLNDQHGHAVGDLLLEEVARRIIGCVREVDTVSRFGGDEFVVLLSELNVDRNNSIAEAGIVAEKIRIILAEPYVLAIRQHGTVETAVTHHCTSSIGVVLFINHETSVDDLLKRADFAMYEAKNGGRNSICFFDATSPMKFG